MALVTTPTISAVVTVIMKEKEGDYGPYQSVLFEGEGLKDGKLWRALSLEEAQQLRKGQAVELTPTKTRQGKEAWNIRLLADSTPTSQPTAPQVRSPQSQPAKSVGRASTGAATPTPQVTPPPPPLSQPTTAKQQPGEPTAEERRQQIESFVFSMANLHAVCYQAAEQAYAGKSAPDEVIRAATSSIFITTERRFRLSSPQ